MRLAAVLAAALLAFAAPPSGARAADDPEPLAQEVDRLLRQLTSDEFAVREAARARLSAVARAARGLLVLRRDDPDPEIRRTVASLLAALGEGEPSPAPAGTLGELGTVAFHAEGTVAEALARWDRELGGRIRVSPAVAAGTVRLALDRRPYFAALDALLAAAGVELVDGFDEAGQAAAQPRPPERPPPPSAAAGPFRLDVDTLTTQRSLRAGRRTSFTLGLRLLWSPAVQVTSFQSPTVDRAVDAKGNVLRGVPLSTVYGVGRARSASTEVRLDPGDDDVGEALAELALTARVRVRHGAREVVFDDLAPGALPAVRAVGEGARGETKVTLVSFGPDADHGGWALAELTASLARGVPPESVVISMDLGDGTSRPLYDLSNRIAGADGTVRLTVRAPNVSTEPAGQRLRVVWYTKEEEIPVAFLLRSVPLK